VTLLSVKANGRLFATIVLLLGTAASLAGARLPVRQYTTDDGLPSNAVVRIVRDSSGFLWFCTREGIARFDGYQFTSFGREQGLPGPVEDLLETHDGNYWLATTVGVVHLNTAGPRPEFLLYRPDGKEPNVYALVEDGAGGVWCGTRSGLYHLEKKAGRWLLEPVEIGMPQGHFGDRLIEALFQDRQGTLWIGGHRALYRRSKDGACTRYALAGGYGPARNHILGFLEDHAGRLWIGTWGGLV
jgi:ligand-binding sensor domain-containing protein